MSDKGQKVAITGDSQGIGASLVTAYRRRGWSVVATARAMKPAFVVAADDRRDRRAGLTRRLARRLQR